MLRGGAGYDSRPGRAAPELILSGPPRRHPRRAARRALNSSAEGIFHNEAYPPARPGALDSLVQAPRGRESYWLLRGTVLWNPTEFSARLKVNLHARQDAFGRSPTRWLPARTARACLPARLSISTWSLCSTPDEDCTYNKDVYVGGLRPGIMGEHPQQRHAVPRPQAVLRHARDQLRHHAAARTGPRSPGSTRRMPIR